MKTLSAKELAELSKTHTNARKPMRLLAIAHFVDGTHRSKIARILKVSRRCVNTWVENYLSLGIEGLNTKKQKGRTSYLSSVQQSELLTYIDKQSKSDTQGRLTDKSIRQYITLNFDVTYLPNAIYKLLRLLVFSWIPRRSTQLKQSQDA